MLTQDQIEKLQPLMKHPKFGLILKDAVEVWKRDDVTPSRGWFGTLHGDNNWILGSNKQCCLIGASLINKPSNFTERLSMFITYQINDSEFESIVNGFDIENPKYVHEHDISEAFKFGFDVGQIVCQ